MNVMMNVNGRKLEKLFLSEIGLKIYNGSFMIHQHRKPKKTRGVRCILCLRHKVNPKNVSKFVQKIERYSYSNSKIKRLIIVTCLTVNRYMYQ